MGAMGARRRLGGGLPVEIGRREDGGEGIVLLVMPLEGHIIDNRVGWDGIVYGLVTLLWTLEGG